jgi:hypothetical protein
MDTPNETGLAPDAPQMIDTEPMNATSRDCKGTRQRLDRKAV